MSFIARDPIPGITPIILLRGVSISNLTSVSRKRLSAFPNVTQLPLCGLLMRGADQHQLPVALQEGLLLLLR